MAYNIQHTLEDNIAAIRLALEWDGKAALTDGDKATLSKYAGFGGIKPVLYPEASPEVWSAEGATKDDLRLHQPMMELHALLRHHFNDTEYKEILRSLKNSVLTAFYTPSVVPETLYSTLQLNGIQPRSLYEPSSGVAYL